MANTDLVPHYGEIIHAQLRGVNADLPQSLSGVSVQQDPEPLSLPVQGRDPLADLLEGLAGEKTHPDGPDTSLSPPAPPPHTEAATRIPQKMILGAGEFICAPQRKI